MVSIDGGLAIADRVVDEHGGEPAGREGHHQRSERQLVALAVVPRSAGDPARMGVQECGQVEPALPVGDKCEIVDP